MSAFEPSAFTMSPFAFMVNGLPFSPRTMFPSSSTRVPSARLNTFFPLIIKGLPSGPLTASMLSSSAATISLLSFSINFFPSALIIGTPFSSTNIPSARLKTLFPLWCNGVPSRPNTASKIWLCKFSGKSICEIAFSIISEPSADLPFTVNLLMSASVPSAFTMSPFTFMVNGLPFLPSTTLPSSSTNVPSARLNTFLPLNIKGLPSGPVNDLIELGFKAAGSSLMSIGFAFKSMPSADTPLIVNLFMSALVPSAFTMSPSAFMVSGFPFLPSKTFPFSSTNVPSSRLNTFLPLNINGLPLGLVIDSIPSSELGKSPSFMRDDNKPMFFAGSPLSIKSRISANSPSTLTISLLSFINSGLPSTPKMGLPSSSSRVPSARL